MEKHTNCKKNLSNNSVRVKNRLFLRLRTWPILVFAVAFVSSLRVCDAESNTWEKKLSEIVWVAYAPTTANPNQGIEPTMESLQEDLVVLHKAGFTGLVTYSCAGLLGQKLPEVAEKQGFKGLILGIWDPNNQKEVAAAIAASDNPFVLGYCVGNEGLGKRYKLEQLTTVIQSLRTLTKKLVATTEELEDYSDKAILELGDWVFPNVHPYFHNKLDPDAAVRWTKSAYDDLKKRSNRFVLFKEVGLPTAGDPEGKMSEAVQKNYYVELAKTDVRFVYFEAFDQPWKTHLPIEPHWGIFASDRTPKLLGRHLLGRMTSQPTDDFFYVYFDSKSRKNHFVPSGYMGDCGDIHIKEDFKNNPHSGETCIQIMYDAKGKGPHTCEYPPPAKWAGVYWQEPPDNWGRNQEWQGRGFNLASYVRLVFCARADKECVIEFKVGGIDGPYGDSLRPARSNRIKLMPTWQSYEINLKKANLSHIIGGFCWVTNWTDNPDGATFYLDDIRFEKE